MRARARVQQSVSARGNERENAKEKARETMKASERERQSKREKTCAPTRAKACCSACSFLSALVSSPVHFGNAKGHGILEFVSESIFAKSDRKNRGRGRSRLDRSALPKTYTDHIAMTETSLPTRMVLGALGGLSDHSLLQKKFQFQFFTLNLQNKIRGRGRRRLDRSALHKDSHRTYRDDRDEPAHPNGSWCLGRSR